MHLEKTWATGRAVRNRGATSGDFALWEGLVDVRLSPTQGLSRLERHDGPGVVHGQRGGQFGDGDGRESDHGRPGDEREVTSDVSAIRPGLVAPW